MTTRRLTTACTRRPISAPLMLVEWGAGDAGRYAASTCDKVLDMREIKEEDVALHP